MLAATLERLLRRQDLSRQEAEGVLRHILAGEASDIQIAALLTALAVKGETTDELVGFASAMRAAAEPIPLPPGIDALVDTCGTGGDARGTFNISTVAAFVVAGAGLRVAKHGNRSITSRCGSADVVEALGVNLDFPTIELGSCLAEVGIAFLYAPRLHPAMRHVQPARRALQVRTAFNLLGPLTNPAGASTQLVGVFDDAWVDKIADVLLRLGTARAWVVHGEDGLDEVSTCAPTHIAEVADGRVRSFVLDARDYGLPRARLDDLAGGSLADYVDAFHEVLGGFPGPRRDIVMLNAAAALTAAGHTPNLTGGLRLAAESIDSGAAASRMRRLCEFTQQNHRAPVIA